MVGTAGRSDERISEDDAKRALEAFINVTTKALKKGDRLSVGGSEDENEGFGTFSISKRSARTGRNPQTGKEIQIAAKNVVKFKAGAELSKAVN
ncbi:HU family DNA-binding protein [Halorubrum salinarum]|uniref:HU family DNA-binding protein n=1 Tax=Halorubrum salinarum TaxID=2739057 RepID=UPI001F455F70|nr:HU family DNA-binding protein [Halorubrum salinarum]